MELERRIKRVMKKKDIKKRIKGIEEIAKTSTLQELRRCLRNKDYFISEGAAQAVKIKAKNGVDCSSAVYDLIVALDNHSKTASFVLATIGTASLTPLLIYLCDCEDYNKRVEVINVIQNILEKNTLI